MKLAVIFPGIGYHTDKPLLYYSKKLAKNYGYEIAEVPYGNFPKGVKGSPDKMKEAFFAAIKQTEEILGEVDFAAYDNLLFISKSIGTAVAAAYADKHGFKTHNIFYTPVAETFPFVKQEGIAFHGTDDPWVETAVVKRECEERKLRLYITEGANHSMETGDVTTDLKNLETIMKQSEEYLKCFLI